MSTIALRLTFPAITKPDKLAVLLALMCSHKELTLGKFDECEPIRRVFDVQRIDEIAQGLMSTDSFYWVGQSRVTRGSVYLTTGKGKPTASVSIWTDAKKLDDPDLLVRFLHEAVGRFGAIHGYVHFVTEPEIQKGVQTHTVGGSPPTLVVARQHLRVCLPDLYWANVFGPDYVALFGRERILSAPAPVVQELARGAVCIQLSGSMLDFDERYEVLEQVRARVKQHLGDEFFFDYESKFRRTYTAPNFGWEEPALPPATTGEELLKALQSMREGRGS